MQAQTPVRTPVSITKYMLPRERELAIVRQHPACLVATCSLTLAGFLAAVIVEAVAPRGTKDLIPALWTAWCLIFLVTVLRLARWTVDYFIVTSDRLIMTSGLISRNVSMIPFATVNDLRFRRPLGGGRMGYIEVLVQFGSREQKVQRIQYLPQPNLLCPLISDLLAPPQADTCKTCRGAGTVFRRVSSQASIQSGQGDYVAVAGLLEHRDDLLKRGFLEVACPTCGGLGSPPHVAEIDASGDE
jgi:Bacterial PH domain